MRFCRKCFLTAMKTSGAHCPMCRGHVSRRERSLPTRASDIESDMKKYSGNCKCCGKQVKFSQMRLHYKSCWKYQKEYGISSKNQNLPFFPPLSDNSVCPVFQCPVCQEEHFDRKGLLDHCNHLHSTQVVSKVCPICVTLPWGDPTFISSNIVDHLNARHQFDYGEYVNLSLDEDTQYQVALVESYQVNF
ncbi:E3 ubiquitin-protein ligase RNF138 isoform X2 [Rhinatrema bivittatum]|uniref:E3 ubiquitin-protein ligase RNF138 isoform X2 n=1 Tax=Rhinatrema bivittatum TaxID=194408 RepID=UPI00112C0747|nr:E3 ubiquitin-protein ligase RNF138 isoform X2 [Rhinatrema bivittatum]